MPLPLLFLFLAALAAYWFMTQVLPERRRVSALRPALAAGLLGVLNERRHADGLPILELDEQLTLVAERKALHQIEGGSSEEGWEYPPEYSPLLGQSLLMEALFTGSAESMANRLLRQRDLLGEEWVACGMGAAAARSGQIVVAVVLCREAWEPVTEEVPALSYEYR